MNQNKLKSFFHSISSAAMKTFSVIGNTFTFKQKELNEKPWLSRYDLSVPASIDIPFQSLDDMLTDTVKKFPDFPVLSYFGKKLSFKKFHTLVINTAIGLENLGLSKGDRIALILPNIPQFAIVYWAALKCGAIVVPINPFLARQEISSQLELSETKIVVILDRLLPKFDSMLFEEKIQTQIVTSLDSFMPPMTKVVYYLQKGLKRQEKAAETSYNQIRLKSLIKRYALKNFAPIDPANTAILLFTGGVTGIPKPVELTHQNLVANVSQTKSWMSGLKEGHEVILGVLPFFHSYGMTACHHLAICIGAQLVLEPRFKVERITRLINKNKVTIFPGVPTMYKALAVYLLKKRKSLNHVKLCVSGGAPLSPDIKKQFEEISTSTLVEGYGLTEASPITHCNPIKGENRKGSIGLPYPNTDARIVDLKSEKKLGVNKIGELQVRGPQIMKGYWNEKKNYSILNKQGWLSTGDIAKMDKDGYFYIVDRKKDVIIIGGFNVYPSEIENIVNKNPKVDECIAVAMNDDYYGQAAKLYVVLKKAARCEKKEIYDFCKDKIAKYKIPKEIEFVDKLPKNFVGKVVKRNLDNWNQQG